MAANTNKLVIVKVFAPWCKACKAIEPKFLAISKDKKYDNLPIVWASLTVAGNKEYIKAQGILALPSMLYYAGSEGLVENFPCGPSKIPIMKRKLAQFINDFVDPETRDLKVMMQPSDLMAMMEEDEPCAERSMILEDAGKGQDSSSLTVAGVSLSKDVMAKLRKIPFFSDLTPTEFTETLQKAKLRTWEEGNVIMREGKKGRTFYFIESGEVEVMVKTAFQDPMTVPSNYLGAMINRLSQNDYFGERALITGEYRAASVRASTKTRCFAFDKDDIPSSSVLSGKGVASAMRLAQVNDKYGVDVSGLELLEVSKQLEDSKMGSQIRGSVNTPEFLPGIDSDEDIDVSDDVPQPTDQEIFTSPAFTTSEDTIITLMQRLRIVKYASRCFDYISKTRPSWNAGALKRRSMLVDQLTSAQKQEFRQVFKLIDVSGDNAISLLELKRVMESIGEEKTDEELQVMIEQTGHLLDGTQVITFSDFMGIMAEAEFYHLFTETFKNLDQENSGFVRAMDLDRVLCGMRDLISDDRKSIIDVEDKDMMIDYEQFSRMLLGGALGGDLAP